MTSKFFETVHIVTFEDTNLVGNVYYSNYFSWQGRAREMFLRTYAPDTLHELQTGKLRLVTAHASCDFADEFEAFDEVVIRMHLLKLIPFGVSLGFEYALQQGIKDGESSHSVVARGRQDIKFLRRQYIPSTQGSPIIAEEFGSNTRWDLAEIPTQLLHAIQPFMA